MWLSGKLDIFQSKKCKTKTKKQKQQNNRPAFPLVPFPAGSAGPLGEGVAKEFGAGRRRHPEAAPSPGWQPADEEGASEAAASYNVLKLLQYPNFTLLSLSLPLLPCFSLSARLQDFVTVSYTRLRYKSLNSAQSNKTKHLCAWLLGWSKPRVHLLLA